MPCWSKSAKRLLRHGVFVAVLITPQVFGSPGLSAAKDVEQVAKVTGVRKILRNQYFVSRYPQIHYYMLYISIDLSGQTYCTEYETPVLEVIADVSSAVGQNVNVVMKGKNIIVRTPKDHKLKTRVVDRNRC